MRPIKFKEQTGTLTKPKSMTDKDCGSLPVRRTGKDIISCWKMNYKDRIKALLFGKIWLHIMGKETHPPVGVVCKKTVFKKVRAKIRRDKNGRNGIPFTQRPEWAPKGLDEIPIKNKL